MAAGDAVVKGSSSFTEQPKQTRWTPERGYHHVRVFHGPLNETTIAALVATLTGTSAEINIARGWPTVVEAAVATSYTDGADDTLTDVLNNAEWSLEPYDLQKTLGTHGKFNSSGASPMGLAVMDAEIRRGVAYGVDYETRYAEGPTSNYNDYRDLRGKAVDEWLTWGYVLRRTLTMDHRSGIASRLQLMSQNQGRVVAWSAIQVPSAALIQQPWVRMYCQGAMGLPAAAFRPETPSSTQPAWCNLWFNEWLVKPPAIRYSRSGRTRQRQVVQEYLGAIQWSATLYDGGTGVP
jgi:hypothetical protein